MPSISWILIQEIWKSAYLWSCEIWWMRPGSLHGKLMLSFCNCQSRCCKNLASTISTVFIFHKKFIDICCCLCCIIACSAAQKIIQCMWCVLVHFPCQDLHDTAGSQNKSSSVTYYLLITQICYSFHCKQLLCDWMPWRKQVQWNLPSICIVF